MAESEHWFEKRRRRHIIVSASQIDTYRLCARKWWLNKVRKLPRVQTKAHTFGTVLAEVLERYLLADDLGYGPDGRPVELYPEGWKKAVNRFTGELDGEINEQEAGQIQRLVAKAIEEGVVERRPGRKPEHEFRFTVIKLACRSCKGSGHVYDTNDQVIKCPTCDGDGQGTHVEIQGAIDVLYPETVEDHKSHKRRAYIKSKNKLKNNTQMLIYGKVLLDEIREEGRPLPPYLTFRHNNFVKDPDDPLVREVSVTVTPQEIEAAWDAVRYDCEMMEHYRQTANAWSDIPDPPDTQSACRAFGGCDFRSICSGRESEQAYADRVDNWVRARNTVPTALTVSATQGDASMSQFNATIAQQGIPAGAPAAAAPPAAVNPPQQAAPPAQAPAQQPAAGGMFQSPTPQGAAPGVPQQPAQAPVQQPQASAPPQAPSQAAPQQPVAQQPAQAPVQQPVGPDYSSVQFTAAPWANPGCGACGGCGFNTKGNPCPVCDAWAAQNNRPTSNTFTLTYENGVAFWQSTANPNYYGKTQLPGTQNEVMAEQQVGVAQQPEPVQQPAQQVAPTPDNAGEAPEVKKKEKGRPKKGFVLVINAACERGAESRGVRRVHDLRQCLNEYAQQIAQQMGVGNFYEIDFNTRISLIQQGADKMIDGFGTEMVVVSGVAINEVTDIKYLIDALYPHAGMVFSNWSASTSG